MRLLDEFEARCPPEGAAGCLPSVDEELEQIQLNPVEIRVVKAANHCGHMEIMLQMLSMLQENPEVVGELGDEAVSIRWHRFCEDELDRLAPSRDVCIGGVPPSNAGPCGQM